ncbi:MULTISPECIES: flagellar hook-basal body complex protein [Caloramator]|uniref:Flagellar hook protein FlgE n=1 Tax=Caloramator australicus RC3 TaxID=857293 RepID=I7K4Y4_9CLOT|nr:MULTISPECIES: flagellar hook-basal body complex protein [Caloramator]WDU83979.1 flagellar hook-basal body complex protein [Caloramator sp. Dgby_cultured_2]CCJ32604.1 Flagellar hook protein FlgE [Caloramator australicus RC3]
MLRSLNSGVSGMKSNQIKMDVIGNNIANVNTTAFKAQRVTFKDILSQTLENAAAPTQNLGGSNPKQAGLGVAIASIDTNMNQGALSTTGRATDLAIEGNGFFVISDGIEYRFTRDGAFTLDANGSLVTSEGFHVLGSYNTAFLADVYDPANPPTVNVDEPAYEPEISAENSPNITELKSIVIPFEALDENGTKQKLLSFSIDKDGTIKGIYGDKTVVIGKVALASFQNPAGLEKLGGNTYRNTANSGAPSIGLPASSGFGTVRQGLLEMSNVDLAEQFTEMIVTSRAFQANSRTITTSDEMLQELLNLKR